MHRSTTLVGALLASALLVATACSSSSSGAGAATTSSSSTSSSSSNSSSESASGGGGVDVSGKSSVKMSAEDFAFSPSTLDGKAGQDLTITLDNEDAVAHNFSIDDQNISVTLQAGQEKDIRVSFPDAGSVEFYCQFHQSGGMTGTLEVA